jgi:hypothetical protein
MEEKSIIIYNTQDGKSSVSLLTKEGTVWMNQNQYCLGVVQIMYLCI